MREIKFRGKRIDTGKWVYGYYFKTPLTVESAKGAEISDGLHFLSGETRHCIAAEDGCVYEVDPKTIGQFTGLHYKNGGEIYEGDIIKIPDNYDEYGMNAGEIYEIYFGFGGFRLKPKYSQSAKGYWLEDDRAVKILGNIHDNTGLLA